MPNKPIAHKMIKLFSCLNCQESGEDRPKPYPLRRKMVIVGDGECGKTCLVTRMSTGKFDDVGYLPTVFETDMVNVSTGKEEVELVIFDTAGQEDYDRLRPLSYNDVDVVLICFNLADQDTLTNVLDNWAPEIRYFCGNAPVILVGNKKDLRDPHTSSGSIASSKASLSGVGLRASLVSLSKASLSGVGVRESSISSSKASLSGVNERGDKELPAVVLSDDPVAPNSKFTRTDSTEVEVSRIPHSISDSLKTLNGSTTSTRPMSTLYEVSSNQYRVNAPVKHSEGALAAQRIGAMAYFETSALTGECVDELLLATTKAAVLGSKKSRKFKPFVNTLKSWKSSGALAK